jgi:hypothetical protein
LLESPGDHTIRLELDAPIAPRGPKGAELGFEIGLPGAPITLLSFEAPTGVRKYTLTTRLARTAGSSETEVEQPEVERFQPGKGGAPLGPITFLGLAWEDPSRKIDVVRTAEAEITVTVAAAELVTEAKLRLRGPATEWRFTAPASADVTVGLWTQPGGGKAPELPPDRIPNVLRPDPGQTTWRLTFREPMASELLVTIVTRQPRGRANDSTSRGPFPIGPFAVLNLPAQTGVVRVRTPPNWRATATLRGDVRRESDDGSGELIYRYRLTDVSAPPARAPIELTVDPVPGVINARVRHELRLAEVGWKLRSEISISPARTEVEHIDIVIPSAFRATVAEPREIVDELAVIREAGVEPQVVRARLSSPKRSSFSFTIEGDYPFPAEQTAGSIPLPRVINVAERSAELVVMAPARFELRGSLRVWEGKKAGTWKTPLTSEPADIGSRLRGVADRPIAAAELSWRLLDVTAVVRCESDVEIDAAQVRVTQRLRYRFGARVPDRIHLSSAVGVQGLRVNRGSVEAAGDGWDLVVPADSGREQEFIIRLTAPAPGDGEFVPPLLLPKSDDLTHVLRVWASNSQTVLLPANVDWMPGPPEVVPERAALPVIVARANGRVGPPTLIVGSRDDLQEGGVVIERTRIDVTLSDEEASYRAAYTVRDWRNEIEFALPRQIRGLEVWVQAKRLTTPVVATGGDGGRIRIPAVAGTQSATVVEFRFRGPPGSLEIPVPLGCQQIAGATWTISVSGSRLTLVPGRIMGSWSPEAFLATLGLGAKGSGSAAEPSLVLQQPELGPVPIYQVPRYIWLLGWSIGAMAVALGIAMLGHRARSAVVLVLAIGLVIAVFGIPQPSSRAVFAAVPGLLAALIMGLVFRWARMRHRRRVSRSFGFARPGSSLVRPSATRPRDASSGEAGPLPAIAPSSS